MSKWFLANGLTVRCIYSSIYAVCLSRHSWPHAFIQFLLRQRTAILLNCYHTNVRELLNSVPADIWHTSCLVSCRNLARFPYHECYCTNTYCLRILGKVVTPLGHLIEGILTRKILGSPTTSLKLTFFSDGLMYYSNWLCETKVWKIVLREKIIDDFHVDTWSFFWIKRTLQQRNRFDGLIFPINRILDRSCSFPFHLCHRKINIASLLCESYTSTAFWYLIFINTYLFLTLAVMTSDSCYLSNCLLAILSSQPPVTANELRHLRWIHVRFQSAVVNSGMWGVVLIYVRVQWRTQMFV